MKIAGYLYNSFVDFPKTLSAVVFTSGCNMNCYYCHNKTLIGGTGTLLNENDVLKDIEKHKKFIDGVVISGGEPTLQRDLIKFITEIKKMGLKVKLDSNGTNPKVLKTLLYNNLIDYIAMDLKCSLSRLKDICECENVEQLKESIDILKQSCIEYEFRTTVCSSLNSKDFEDIGKLAKGCQHFYLQRCNENGIEYSIGTKNLLDAKAIIEKYVDNIHIRNLN